MGPTCEGSGHIEHWCTGSFRARPWPRELDMSPTCEGSGHIEYWCPGSFRAPEAGVSFGSKLDTDLYAHAKAKTVARSLAVSRDGAQFATFSADRCGF